MSGDDLKEPSMVFQPWRFKPPGSTPTKNVLCLAPYYFRVCLRFNSWFVFQMVVALFVSYNFWHVFL